MIDQLKKLENTILQIRKQYQQAHQELMSLKQNPSVDAKEYQDLKSQFEHCQKEREAYKSKLSELDGRYQSLAEAHHLIGEEQDKLQQQIDELTQKNTELTTQNDKLLEKNRIAAEHTQVVLQRLTQIDRMEE